jgi:hypothetical protein
MLLVVALNGFLGNREKHTDVTDIVDDLLAFMPQHDYVKVIRGHGGQGPIAFNALYKQIAKFANKDTTVVFIGKSYGGHWCVRLLWRFADKDLLCKFKKVGVLTVDPSYALHRLQRKMVEIPHVDLAINIHQYGYRSGYRLGSPAENIAVPGEHTTIEKHPTVPATIKKMLQWGLGFKGAQ